MDSNWGKLLRIGVFYDGHYFFSVSNYYNYQHDRRARISISGLHEFIQSEVAARIGIDPKQCQIVDAHYFKGRYSAQKSDELNKLYNERAFDDILMRENVTTHYLPLSYDKNGRPQEKGVDVWLALEAYELSIYKQYDILVLLACDGDYVPLVRKLKSLGSQVMLLSWDFEYMDSRGNERETRTSQSLLEEVSYYTPMHERIDSRAADTSPMIRNMFLPPREQNRHTDVVPSEEVQVEAEEGGEEFFESEILNLNRGYGFIKDAEVNNVYFHHTSLQNIDFNDLVIKTPVRYSQEYRDGKYMATQVWVIDRPLADV